MVESKKYENVIEKVSEYFRKNDIKNLMDYGCDTDEGLYHLSTMYEEILNKLNVKFDSIYTEDGISDGKYTTTIIFENDSKVIVDISAFNGIKVVVNNIETIYQESLKIEKNNDEIDLDIWS